jgi:hypothetical protein
MSTLSSQAKKTVQQEVRKSIGTRGPKETGNNLNHLLNTLFNNVTPQILIQCKNKWVQSNLLDTETKTKLKTVSTTDELFSILISNVVLMDTLVLVSNSFSQVKKSFNGGIFADSVREILNDGFKVMGLPLKSHTSGSVISKFKQKLSSITDGLKPDVDMVIENILTGEIICIISCKTSLFERITQTITWKSKLEIGGCSLPIVAVTQHSFGGINIDRVKCLDSTFVCDPTMNEYEKIFKFEKIFDYLSKVNSVK